VISLLEFGVFPKHQTPNNQTPKQVESNLNLRFFFGAPDREHQRKILKRNDNA
jgi:hypothetical protein